MHASSQLHNPQFSTGYPDFPTMRVLTRISDQARIARGSPPPRCWPKCQRSGCGDAGVERAARADGVVPPHDRMLDPLARLEWLHRLRPALSGRGRS